MSINSMIDMVIKPNQINYGNSNKIPYIEKFPPEGYIRDLLKQRNFPPIPHEMSALMQVLRLVVTLFYRAKSKELCSME